MVGVGEPTAKSGWVVWCAAASPSNDQQCAQCQIVACELAIEINQQMCRLITHLAWLRATSVPFGLESFNSQLPIFRALLAPWQAYDVVLPFAAHRKAFCMIYAPN